MGCGASTATATVPDELMTQQHDRLTRGKFIPTIIPKEGNDYTLLMKALEEAASHILFDKQKAQQDSLATYTKGRSKNAGKGNSRFNQILENRRQAQEEALGRTPRASSTPRITSPRSPPLTRRDSTATPRNPTAFAFDEPTASDVDLGPAHGDVALRSLPYNAKLILLRLIRHPLGFVHYWNFTKYLDYNSAVTLSPNVEEAVRQKAMNDSAAFLNLKMVPNFSIPHTPTLSSDSPFEAIFLLFTHLDKLTRMGTVPPQMKNTFGYIIHFHPNDEPMAVTSPVANAHPHSNALKSMRNANKGLASSKKHDTKSVRGQVLPPAHGRRMSVPILDVTIPASDAELPPVTQPNNQDAGKRRALDPQQSVPSMDVESLVVPQANPITMTSQSSEALSRRCVQAQKALQAQYVAQATIIREHKTFYEGLITQALNIYDTFCEPAGVMFPAKFRPDRFYVPNALTKTVKTFLPPTTVDMLSRSLLAYIKVLKAVLVGVTHVDNQHQANLKFIESAERAGGLLHGHATQGYIFTTTHNEYYTDLDIYDILLRCPFVPTLGRIDSIGARFTNPFLSAGAGMSAAQIRIISNSRATDGLASMSNAVASQGIFSLKSSKMKPSPLASAQASLISCAPRADGYQYQAMCVPPRTTYIPEAGLRYAREQILGYLAAYTLSPFILSGVYGVLKQNITACATQLINAAHKKSVDTPSSNTGFPLARTLSPSPGIGAATVPLPGSSSSIISSAMQPLAAQQQQGIPVLTSAQMPPQMLLQACIKCANFAAWAGYGVPGQHSIGMGPHPLIISPGNPMIENLGLAPATIHPYNDSSSVNTKNGLPRRASIVPGIMTQQTNEQVNTLSPLGAFDLSRGIISREMIKAFGYAAALAPPQIGVCVISMLSLSSNHNAWVKYKNQNVSGLSMISQQMNTCKVVFTNQEFAKMCGASESDFTSNSGSAAAMGSPGSNTIYTFNSNGVNPDININKPPSPDGALSTAASDQQAQSTSGGYLSILGRDYKDLFVDDGDKEYLLDQITSLKHVHAFARLATPNGKQYTPVVLSMKPVFMRIRPNPQNVEKAINMGMGAAVATPTSDAFRGTNQYDIDTTDVDSFDTNAKTYSETFISPLFFICTAIRVKAPPKPVIRGSPASTGRTLEDDGMVASVYSEFPSVSPLFSVEKKTPQKSVQKTSTIAEINDTSRFHKTTTTLAVPALSQNDAGMNEASLFIDKSEEDDVFDYSDADRELMLKSRWAHDHAWLSLFPDIHDVILP